MGLCGRRMACLPMGPFVATGRLSCAKYNHFPIPRMFCLPQRKMRRTGTGKEVAPRGNSSVNLSAPLVSLGPLCLSSLCLYSSLYVSLSLSSFLNVQCLSIFICLSLYFSVFISAPLFQSLLSPLLLSLFLCLSPTSLSSLLLVSFFFFSSFLPPLLFKLFGTRPHRHCYTSTCHPDFVLRNSPLRGSIKN